ncbi:MAG TPA: hypothetical protein VHO84_15190 [Syntrophorhabdaceae bacterium]|nr:hypothetical protein [Syntrophorhabdaceae bacterium]
MIEWVKGHENIFVWISIASFVLLLGSLVFAVIFIIRMPSDYFIREKQGDKNITAEREKSKVFVVAKNLLGYILLIAGVLMLILPGQGFITMLIGIFLVDFPGKHKIVKWIGTRKGVLRSMNWVRRRAGRGPIMK